MQAVIKTGGKQYLVAPGDKIKIEKLPVEAGQSVKFEEVLLTSKDDKITIGTPLVKGAVVEAKVIDHARHPKLFGVKMKAKKRNRQVLGHKQHYTQVEINTIKA